MEDFGSSDRGIVDIGSIRHFGAEPRLSDRAAMEMTEISVDAKPIDVAAMLRNSRNPSSPDAFEDSKKLDEMCVTFFEKLHIPMNIPWPVLFLSSLNGEPLLVMKGLLVNDEIMAAFAKIPEVQVLKSPPKFFGTPVFDEEGNLDLTKMEVGPRMVEFQMPVKFFESVVCGEVGNVVSETSSRAERVIEA